MRAGNQIGAATLRVVLDLQIANRDRRHVVPERLPVIAIVERDPHLRIGPGKQQPRLPRVFTNRVRNGVGGDPRIDFRPRLAAIARAIEVRLDLVEAQRVGGGVGDERVEVPRLDIEDARPGLDR